MQFFEYVESYDAVCLVGHYVSFDTAVLKSELKREKLALKRLFTIDTLELIGFIAPSYDMRDLERYAIAFGTRIYDRHHTKNLPNQIPSIKPHKNCNAYHSIDRFVK